MMVGHAHIRAFAIGHIDVGVRLAFVMGGGGAEEITGAERKGP
jgi:hypothetical protein